MEAISLWDLLHCSTNEQIDRHINKRKREKKKRKRKRMPDVLPLDDNILFALIKNVLGCIFSTQPFNISTFRETKRFVMITELE